MVPLKCEQGVSHLWKYVTTGNMEVNKEMNVYHFMQDYDWRDRAELVGIFMQEIRSFMSDGRWSSEQTPCRSWQGARVDLQKGSAIAISGRTELRLIATFEASCSKLSIWNVIW